MDEFGRVPMLTGNLLSRILHGKGPPDHHGDENDYQQTAVHKKPDGDHRPSWGAQERISRKAAKQHERAYLEDLERSARREQISQQ
jgi:hypothetical protein